jgi:uncharacterized protein YbaP (TraB family)
VRHAFGTSGKVLLVLLTFILLIGTFCSCSSGQKLFFWKVSSGTKYVYILGDVSINEEGMFPFNSTIEDAFTSSKNLTVLVYNNNVDPDESTQYIMDHATYPEGDGFRKHVDETFYQELFDFTKNFGLNLAGYDQYKPWIIYNVISQQVFNYYGYTSEYNISNYFTTKAEKASKAIIELEPWQYTYDLYGSVPDDVIIKMIQYDVNSTATEQDLKDMLTAWKNGDVTAMNNLVFKPRQANPDVEPYYTITYEDRAVNLLEKIKPILNGTETSFIIIRAGLLVGDNGLLNLLSSAGYTVEQLNAS